MRLLIHNKLQNINQASPAFKTNFHNKLVRQLLFAKIPNTLTLCNNLYSKICPQL